MEAKDTVEPVPSHSESVVCPHCGEEFGQEGYIQTIRNLQAEATWPIAEKAGRKEAVEWLRSNGYLIDGHTQSDLKKLRAKLKEWGIEE